MKASIAALLLVCSSGCLNVRPPSDPFVDGPGPGDHPVAFRPALVPEGMLLHGGSFSPDQREFMYTLSDKEFRHFDVKRIRWNGSSWSAPEDAFFNSAANEHGTSYSPDGKTLFFSSTRAVDRPGAARNWQLWKCEKDGDLWSDPVHVDIPNLRNRLVSHASVAADGTLYFHAGEPDYSRLDIYSASPDGHRYADAVKLPSQVNRAAQQCTPFIDPARRFLIYESPNGLAISFRNQRGDWSQAVPLGEASPTPGRGNPHVSPDGRFLFFAAGDDPESNPQATWLLYWVHADQLIARARAQATVGP